MKRYRIGIHHKNGIGIPGEMKEHPQGEYVRYVDIAMPADISRALLGQIVDEVFDGAIEDVSVIEDIYRVIACEFALQSQDREDAERWQHVRKNPIAAIDSLRINCGHDPASWGDEAEKAIDHARRIEGEGK